jgi:cbb3-type cytochrome oxidase subunit 3
VIRDLLEGSAGLSVYAVTGLVVFLLVFLGAVYFVLRMNRRHVEAMRRLPLQDDSPSHGDPRHD